MGDNSTDSSSLSPPNTPVHMSVDNSRQHVPTPDPNANESRQPPPLKARRQNTVALTRDLLQARMNYRSAHEMATGGPSTSGGQSLDQQVSLNQYILHWLSGHVPQPEPVVYQTFDLASYRSICSYSSDEENDEVAKIMENIQKDLTPARPGSDHLPKIYSHSLEVLFVDSPVVPRALRILPFCNLTSNSGRVSPNVTPNVTPNQDARSPVVSRRDAGTDAPSSSDTDVVGLLMANDGCIGDSALPGQERDCLESSPSLLSFRELAITVNSDEERSGQGSGRNSRASSPKRAKN